MLWRANDSIKVCLSSRVKPCDGGGCLDKPTRDMPVPCSFSEADTQAMTEKISDGPNAPFSKRPVCGVPQSGLHKRGA